MLERVILFSVHSAIHVAFYTIPRALFALFVRLPRTLWDLITFHRPFTYSFKRERHIKVVRAGSEKGEEMMARFGLNDEMYYSGPMYNGHIHTVFGNLRLSNRVKYEREYFPAEDTNPICLDWYYTKLSPSKGIVFIVCGAGNYCQTPYLQSITRLAAKEGFHTCVYTHRGMGSAPLTVPELSSVVFTSDLRWLLRKYLQKDLLEKKFGVLLPVMAVGYSAGANILCKAVAEEQILSRTDKSLYGDQFPFDLLVAVSGPYDMASHSAAMLSFWGRILYQKPLMLALKKFAVKHRKVLEQGIKGVEKKDDNIPFEKKLDQFRNVQDFEIHIVVPHFGYRDLEHYYEDGSSFKWIKQCSNKTPIICTASLDDVITGYGCTRADWQDLVDSCNNVLYVETPCGGHLGYYGSPLDEYKRNPSFLGRFPIECFKHFVASNAKE